MNPAVATRRTVTVREQVAAEQFSTVTERSISDARLAMLTERRALEAEFGIEFDPFRDGQIKRDRRTR